MMLAMHKISIKTITLSFIFSCLIFIYPKNIKAQIPDATFSFDPAFSTFTQETDSVINIKINTGSNTSNAADIIINYNPEEIEIIQVSSGSAYESYDGNIVDSSTGKIRLTGFSTTGILSGTRTFGTIKFRSKHGITQTSLSIEFSGIGDTFDSNIADRNTSTDILGLVTDGTYSFVPAEEPTPPTPEEPTEEDITNPYIEFVSPQNYDTDIPSDSNIIFKISDDDSGVNIESIIVYVNGDEYSYINGSNFSYEGDSSCYTIIITPYEKFETDEPVIIIIKGSDNEGNAIQKTLLFNVPPEATNCFYEIQDKLDELDDCKEKLSECLNKLDSKGISLEANEGTISSRLGIDIYGFFSILALLILIIHPYWRNPNNSDTFNKLFMSDIFNIMIFVLGFILAIIGVIDLWIILSIATLILYLIAILLTILRCKRKNNNLE